MKNNGTLVMDILKYLKCRRIQLIFVPRLKYVQKKTIHAIEKVATTIIDSGCNLIQLNASELYLCVSFQHNRLNWTLTLSHASFPPLCIPRPLSFGFSAFSCKLLYRTKLICNFRLNHIVQ